MADWTGLVATGDFRRLVAELLERHYDPLYQRSQTKNFSAFGSAAAIVSDDLSPSGMTQLAQEIIESAGRA